MKTWNFQINKSTSEISRKIESSLGLAKSFVYNRNNEKDDSVKFRIRKRLLYPWYLFYVNSIVVKGTLSKTDIENESDVKISFRQHFLWRLVIFTDAVVGLAILITATQWGNNRFAMFLTGTIILGIGILLGLRVQKKYHHDIKEYKSLISGILES